MRRRGKQPLQKNRGYSLSRLKCYALFFCMIFLFFLGCKGATYRHLWHLHLSRSFECTNAEASITRYLATFAAKTARNSIKFSTTDMAPPCNYLFLFQHCNLCLFVVMFVTWISLTKFASCTVSPFSFYNFRSIMLRITCAGNHRYQNQTVFILRQVDVVVIYPKNINILSSVLTKHR
jgi:hypothetical protein